MNRNLFCCFIITLFCLSIYNGDLMSEDFTIKSTDFVNNGNIPEKYSCNGTVPNGLSPNIIISGIPKETKSLYLIMEDPDASSSKKPFIHLIAQLKLDVSKINEGGINQSSLRIIKNDADMKDFYGPCPPKGKEHHYYFTLTALNTDSFNLDEHTVGFFRGTWNKTSAFIKEVKSNIIGFTQLMGKYGKKI